MSSRLDDSHAAPPAPRQPVESAAAGPRPRRRRGPWRSSQPARPAASSGRDRRLRVREEKRFTVKGSPDVKLATFDGSIVIRGWDRDEVSVEIEKRGRDKAAVDDIEIVTEQKGNVDPPRGPAEGGAAKRSYGIGCCTTCR